MKQRIIILALLLVGIELYAENSHLESYTISKKNNTERTISFIEKGISFQLYLNGHFSFEIIGNHYSDYNYGHRYRRAASVRIVKNHFGDVIRIGDVFIDYNRHRKVTRIGNVYLNYHRNNLIKVGHLKIKYNSWRKPIFYGQVNVQSTYYDYYPPSNDIIYDYNDSYFFNIEFRNNYNLYKEDPHFYYYKSKPNVKNRKRGEIIKRKKQHNNFTQSKMDKNNSKKRENFKSSKRYDNRKTRAL